MELQIMILGMRECLGDAREDGTQNLHVMGALWHFVSNLMGLKSNPEFHI